MKNIITSLAILLATGAAHASYMERCVFQAELQSIASGGTLGEMTEGMEHFAIIKILAAQDVGSHSDKACERQVGQQAVLKLASYQERQKLEADQDKIAEFDYMFVSGMTPTGVRSGSRWSLKEEVAAPAEAAEEFKPQAPTTVVYE